MSKIKLDVNIQMPKIEVITRSESPSEFKGIPRKYKYKTIEDGILENYFESKLHM